VHQLRPCFYGRLFLRTQDIIRAQLKDIPGELFERPWKNFGHNRTEALELARGRADYAFVVDADEVLELPVDFSVPALSLDAYSLLIEIRRHKLLEDVPRRGTAWVALPRRFA
jgi:hypothetical protein